MQKISAVLNTYNEGKHLEEALKHLKAFDEIVVCDMESTDDTRDIALRNGCRVVIFPKGDITICEPARNAAIQAAGNEWVLVVDADEIIPAELADYLKDYVNSPEAGQALNIARINLFWTGRPTVAYPDYQCRLVRKSNCYWPETIHSRPIIEGRIDSIPKGRRDLAMVHMPVEVDQYFHKKLCVYTNNEVDRRLAHYKKDVSFCEILFSPFFRFFKTYFIKGAIWRGKDGFIEAACEATYKFVTLCKIYGHQVDRAKSSEKE